MRFCLLILALLLLVGCAAPSDPLAYQRDGASLALTGAVDATDFAATLELAPIAEDTPLDARPFTLTYTAPEALAGITLAADGETVTLTRGPIVDTVRDDRYAGLLLPAALFCIDCPMGTAAVIEQNGTTLNRVTAADDEGSYTVWLDEAGLPRRIEAVIGERTVTVDVVGR